MVLDVGCYFFNSGSSQKAKQSIHIMTVKYQYDYSDFETRKIQRGYNGAAANLNLPRKYMERLKWKVSDKLKVRALKNKLVLQKVK